MSSMIDFSAPTRLAEPPVRETVEGSGPCGSVETGGTMRPPGSQVVCRAMKAVSLFAACLATASLAACGSTTGFNNDSVYHQLLAVVPSSVQSTCVKGRHDGSPPQDIVAEAGCSPSGLPSTAELTYHSYDTVQDAAAALRGPRGSPCDATTLGTLAQYGVRFPGMTCGAYGGARPYGASPYNIDWVSGRVLVDYSGPVSEWPVVAALNVTVMRAEHLLSDS
jgi:hypothetical protein